MLPEFFKFSLPTKVLYSEGLVSRLGPELKELGSKTAFIITDKTIVKAGLLHTLKKGLEGSRIEIGAVFDDVPQNSELAVVKAATEMGLAKQCDLIIALGGGSVLDSAKVINLLMFKGGDIQDHMGAQLVKGRLNPMVFIPTTAGTGSEVTQFAVIADIKNNVKLPFAEDAFLPDYAILDPEMTATMPGKVTAATGMDALTHAIESYVSIEANPTSEALALYAIELIHNNIRQACAQPDDLQARGAMLVASFMAAVAFNHAGVGIVHGISHALGGVYHIPHGLANAIILPFSIEHNLETSFAKYARISQIFGEGNFYPVNEINRSVSKLNMFLLNQAVDQLTFVDEWLMRQRAKTLSDKLRLLNRQLSFLTGLATNLKSAGIQDSLAKIDLVVSTAMADGATLYNPVPVTEDAIRNIVEKAYAQNLQPLEVSQGELKANVSAKFAPKMKGIYADTAVLYDILGGYFKRIQADSELSEKLLNSGLKVRFNYFEPQGAIALDGTTKNKDKQILLDKDAHSMEPDVEFTLPADVAHYFWHGKVNLVQALSRKEIIPRGNLAKAMKLLPLLEPAYTLYPKYLREKGLGKIVVG